MERSWYQQSWAIIALVVLFFPVGLYLMWRHASWQPMVKWGVSGVYGVLIVIVVVSLALSGGSDDAGSEQVAGDEPTPAASSPTATALAEAEELDSTETPMPVEPTQTPPPEPTEPAPPTSSPPPLVFQQASDFPLGSPERTVAEYAAAWRDQDWQRMVNFTQITWLDSSPDAPDELAAFYDFKLLHGFEISGVEQITDVAARVTFSVAYELFAGEIETKEITAMVIKEVAPLSPSPEGQWGVNPISTLREVDVD